MLIFECFWTFWTLNRLFFIENRRFFLNQPHFFRRIRWWHSFFSKIKWDAIFWGMKLKNHENFRSTKNFVSTENLSKTVENRRFFFKLAPFFAQNSMVLLVFFKNQAECPNLAKKPKNRCSKNHDFSTFLAKIWVST